MHRLFWPVPILALLAALPMSCGQVITRVTPTPSATATTGLPVAPSPRPTATPAPYTPAPTATPTITPTPIIYRIQRGDTLLKIAGQFGVTVRSLQETNGITDPRALRVGQELIVPLDEDKDSGTPTAAPTPVPFTVENITFSSTPLGGLWCFGEILNTSGGDLEQAGVTASLLDGSGAVLAQEQGYVQTEFLRPGERAPFALRFAAAPAAFDSYLVVPWKGVPGFKGNYYVDLTARETTGVSERYATYTVTGVIENTGPEDAVEVSVTVTVYDALGRVIGVRRAPPEYNVIPRGGASSFAVELTPAGGPVSSFLVQALGRRAPTPTPGAG